MNPNKIISAINALAVPLAAVATRTQLMLDVLASIERHLEAIERQQKDALEEATRLAESDR